MFRDRCISYLIHAFQVLYALSILVGSPFMFPNPYRILHVISNPCRICFYVCNPSQIHLIWSSMYLYVDMPSIFFLLETPRKGFKMSPRSSNTKPNNATILGEWIVKSAHIFLVMNSDFQGCSKSPFWPTATIFWHR